VRQTNQRRLLDSVAPLARGVGHSLNVLGYIAFGWWLAPWLQRRANRKLRDDVVASLYFLVSQPNVVLSSPGKVLPFDYASVEIHWRNLLITVSRGRGDTTVSVAPADGPQESYELGRVLATLEHRHSSQHDLFNDLAGAASLLRPRIAALNDAFSEREFHRLKQRL
jgi:hypothetical protein